MKLARTTPYYKRNRAHICSFWVKGECKRGEECPYRHEMPTDPNDPLANQVCPPSVLPSVHDYICSGLKNSTFSQNIKDRYYGVDDPVADKLLKRASEMPKLTPPSDKSITTIYVGGLDANIKEQDLKDAFYQYGEIRNINIVTKSGCAFVNFSMRDSAEKAVQGSFNKLIIKGRRLKILWGRGQGAPSDRGPAHDAARPLPPVPGLPPALPQPPAELLAHDFFGLAGESSIAPPPGTVPALAGGVLPPLPGPAGLRVPLMAPPGTHVIHYPSQDPQRLGTSKSRGADN